MTSTTITVNGRAVTADVEPRLSLADFLREHEGLTGTHTACEHGVCGACTIMLDGRPARSCITLAVAAHGTDVRTVEGWGGDETMATIRDCFRKAHAVQCGYCTPGMLATAYDIVTRLLGRRPRPDQAGAFRQSLPLHRLYRHRGRDRDGARGDRARLIGRPRRPSRPASGR